MHNYKELSIWRRSVAIAVEVYKITVVFPVSEKYGLTSQVNRAAVSIASNIAEGVGRNTNNEFIHFLGVANGSSFELATQLIISAELHLVTYDRINKILEELDQVQKMVYSFIKKLRKEKK